LRKRAGWIRVRWFEVRWEAGKRTDPSSTHLLQLLWRRISWNGLGGGSLSWLILVGRRMRRRGWKGGDGLMRGEGVTLKRRECFINPSHSLSSLPSQAWHWTALAVRKQHLLQASVLNPSHQFSLSCPSSLQTPSLSHLRVLQENLKLQLL